MSSSNLGKRKKYIDNDNNDNIHSSPLKKAKLSSTFINYKNSFSSIICIDNISYNNYYTLCINNNSNVFSIGYCFNKSHGHKKQYTVPFKQISDLINIKMISCGNSHSICLNYEGDIFSFGNNDNGQLGKNKSEVIQTYIPQKINIPSKVKQVSCGSYFTICLSESNKLYAFGYNGDGQLGLGTNTEKYSTPQLIPDLDNIEFIVCGYSHVICKTYNNEFYSWGDNYFGQLGQRIENEFDDEPYYESCNKPSQCLNWPDNIISIKSGDNHSLLLTKEGQVYSFGNNDDGQLGINDKHIKINIPTLIKDIPEIQRIECGSNHVMCIDINDNLWLFGHNEGGQLGLGDTENRYKPILHPTLSNIIDISSGGNHTFVKTSENKIYAFGNNKYSQLGKKTSEYKQLTPIQVLEGKEDIWSSTIGKSKQKSARK